MNVKLTRKLLAALLALCMLMALAACQNTAQPGETTAPNQTGAPETTAPTVTKPKEEKMVVYWNLDREDYADKAREKEADGTYKVRFAVNSRLETVKVQGSEDLIKKIDSLQYMCLVMDDTKTVTEVKTIQEMGGSVVTENAFVESYGSSKLSINTKADLSGESSNVSVGFQTYITDVSGDMVSALYSLIATDSVVVIADKTGLITDVFMTAEGEVRKGKTAYCEHCKEDVHWEAWVDTTCLPISSSGHYYLFSDIYVGKQQSLAADVALVIDLNGKLVTRKDDSELDGTGRVISIHNEGSYLGIMDSSEGKTGKIKVFGNAYALGAAVWLRGGNFDLFSGTLDGSEAVDSSKGTVVSVSAGRTFNMYGGTIIGGISTGAVEVESNPGGLGGSVYVAGTFNMFGGEIRDGKVISAEGETEKVMGYGGNVYVAKDAVFNMSGGAIYGGSADKDGNDVYVDELGTFNQTGGTIG